ncbi:hypothetical protein PTTG_11234 [Puccinia triticina 1-1 BBBD Race 1]|uniref:Uncharacterized protein n=1 Tax=Puccinia triticina (isolate 1-1 / race 1 (BBBD)) TaxID=630390 RepID=A0A180GBW0_PUCT1|nr:hypothetical protein PTTG_11234 [Puccinia triticina 1-1 BBBD Race 1]
MKFKHLTQKDAPAPIPVKDTSKDSAMDLDIPPSTSSAATPALPTTTGNPALPAAREISSPLEKEKAAQESQKALQKIMPNDEIEAFVKGWNPWTEKKKFFPAPPKEERFGKR